MLLNKLKIKQILSCSITVCAAVLLGSEANAMWPFAKELAVRSARVSTAVLRAPSISTYKQAAMTLGRSVVTFATMPESASWREPRSIDRSHVRSFSSMPVSAGYALDPDLIAQDIKKMETNCTPTAKAYDKYVEASERDGLSDVVMRMQEAIKNIHAAIKSNDTKAPIKIFARGFDDAYRIWCSRITDLIHDTSEHNVKLLEEMELQGIDIYWY